jgi:hypothetical protein
MTTRIYLVGPKNGAAGGRNRLVRATSQAQALRHVVDDTLAVRLASQDDIVRIMLERDPCEVEDATGEAPENPSGKGAR